VKPVVLMTAQRVPAPVYELTDMDKLNEVKTASYASFTMLENMLRDYHGDLDSAPKPCQGQLISLKLRFENYGALFEDPGWPKILHGLLRKDFVGFPAGAIADVIPMHGQPPIVTMTCLVFKSEATNSLYSNPVVNKSFTMNSFGKKIVCSVSATERPLSCPAQGIIVGTAQIIQTYLPDPKEFAGVTLRYKQALAEVFHNGIWNQLNREEMMERFAVRKKPQYLDQIARTSQSLYMC